MEKKYVMTIDGGTTSTRVVFFDRNAKLVSSAAKEITQLYPQPGWHLQDAIEGWNVLLECMEKLWRRAAFLLMRSQA